MRLAPAGSRKERVLCGKYNVSETRRTKGKDTFAKTRQEINLSCIKTKFKTAQNYLRRLFCCLFTEKIYFSKRNPVSK